MNPQVKLFLFCLCLFFAGLVIISYFWSSDQFYTGAYQPIVERSLENQRYKELQDKKGKRSGGDGWGSSRSNEPRAAGLREREIEKKKGDRYSTY